MRPICNPKISWHEKNVEARASHIILLILMHLTTKPCFPTNHYMLKLITLSIIRTIASMRFSLLTIMGERALGSCTTRVTPWVLPITYVQHKVHPGMVCQPITYVQHKVHHDCYAFEAFGIHTTKYTMVSCTSQLSMFTKGYTMSSILLNFFVYTPRSLAYVISKEVHK